MSETMEILSIVILGIMMLLTVGVYGLIALFVWDRFKN